MTSHSWTLLAVYSLVLLLLAIPTGRYIANVMEGRFRLASRIEAGLYRLCGVRADVDMGWLQYALAILLFNGLGVLVVYAMQRVQSWLPLNPQAMANISPDSSFNTAISFVTNTNWQGYSGEQAMSYLTQMLALAVQNFFSAATGIVVVIALIRGFARHSIKGIGNAWVDLTRVTCGSWCRCRSSSPFSSSSKASCRTSTRTRTCRLSRSTSGRSPGSVSTANR